MENRDRTLGEGIARQELHLIFIIDNSGSMEGEKLGAVNNAIRDVMSIMPDIQDDTGDAIIVSGESADVKSAVRVLEYLKRMIGDGESLSEQSIEYVISAVKDGQDEGLEDCSKDVICITNRGKPIKAKTIGQKKYIKAIKSNTLPKRW